MKKMAAPLVDPADYEELRTRLDEAEETLRAIRCGEVDGLVVSGEQGDQIFTLKDALHPYQVMLEEMNEGALTLSTEGIILYGNSRFAEMVGMTREGILGEHLSKFTSDLDADGVNRFMQACLESGSKGELELASAGENCSAEISLKEVMLDGTRRLCAVLFDITERKKIEEELERHRHRLEELVGQRTTELSTANQKLQEEVTERTAAEAKLAQSEKKYRELIQFAPAGIYEVDFRTRKFISVNDSMCELSGYSREELMASDPFEPLLDQPSQALFQQRIQQWLAGEKPPENVEYHVIGKGGKEIYAVLNITFTRDEQGHPLGATVVGYDISERRRMQQQVQEIANKYSMLFDATSDGVWIHNLNGMIVEVNDAYCRMSGYSRVELIGMQVSQLEAVESPNEVTTHIQNLRKEGGHERFESLHRRKDGSLFTVDITALYLERKGGQVAIFARDISERKEVEQKLAYQAFLLSQVYDGIIGSDSQARITYWNAGMEQIYGFSAAEALGKTSRELLKPIYTGNERERILEELEIQGSSSAEIRTLHKDGHEVRAAVSSRKLTDASGSTSGYVVVYRDITRSKQIETALVESKNKFQALIETTSDFIWEMDSQGRYSYCSPQAETLWGYKPEDMLGKTPFDKMPEETKLQMQDFFMEIIRTQKPFSNLVSPAVVSEGRLAYVETSGVPFFGEEGQFMGYRGITRDITERKMAEETIVKARLEAEQRADELEAMMEAVPIGVMITRDPEGLEISGNRSAHQLLQVPEGEPNISKSVPDSSGLRTYRPVRNGVDVPVDQLPIQLAARGNEVKDWDCDLVFDNGETSHVLINATPLFDENMHPRGAIAALLDISERERKEKELQRLNRTLQALSGINQAMIHSNDEHAFMNEVCRIVVEDCGHAMVWIGMAEQDEAKSVRPVANSGFDEGYLQAMKINWADTERGQGPTGTAIRTGQVASCRNMLTDPKFEPWRDAALKRGYASSIALPLIESGTAFGALTIYSREPDPFTEHEVALLTELAGDLAYGINMLRTRQAREQAQEALRQSEMRFRSVLDNSVDVVYRFNIVENRYEYISPSCEVIVGFTAAELMGGEGLKKEMIHPDDWPSFAAGLTNLENSSPQNLEYRQVTKTGEYRWLSNQVSLLRDSAGRPLYRDGNIRDITIRKQYEEKIKKAAEELMAANEELRRFNNLMVGRELRMIELKKEINQLYEAAGLSPKYNLPVENQQP